MYALIGKRLVDLAGSAVGLIVLSPLWLLTSVLIWLEDRGPVLYRQPRLGRHGTMFTVLKFRSMPVNARSVASIDATALPVTRVGRVIRRTNIDELPQLLNVLRGDMSLVGPRPALPSQHGLIAARKLTRAADVRPGLTGLAQLRAFDGMSEADKAGHDGEYAERITLLGDVGILVRTINYLRKPPPTY